MTQFFQILSIKMTQFIKVNDTIFSIFKYKNDIIYKF